MKSVYLQEERQFKNRCWLAESPLNEKHFFYPSGVMSSSYLSYSFLPALNDLALPEFELKGLVPVSRGVKLLPILQHTCQKRNDRSKSQRRIWLKTCFLAISSRLSALILMAVFSFIRVIRHPRTPSSSVANVFGMRHFQIKVWGMTVARRLLIAILGRFQLPEWTKGMWIRMRWPGLVDYFWSELGQRSPCI